MIGGVANSPVTVKANASADVIVRLSAAASVGGAEAKAEAEPNTAATSNTVAKKATVANTAKGKEAMNSINTGNKNVGCKASSLLGE